MIIPLANAIFDGKLNIQEFYKKKKFNNNTILENLYFQRVDKKTFPIIKLKNELNKFPSTPIIINAVNEVLVSEFLKKKTALFEHIQTYLWHNEG
jgi:1-deoxy-D-xylulose 5-phosphate reductoisomerase